MGDKPRILYVDDDPDQLQLFQLSLRDEFDVTTADSGSQAVRLLSEDASYAAVVSDMRMPRMNGAQLLGLVREIAPHAIRILLTGDADLHSAMEAINLGYVFRYLTKPCPRVQLQQALRDAVQQHRELKQQAGLSRKLHSAAGQMTSDMSELDPRTETHRLLGSMIAGRYRLDEALGVGGSAAVFRCHDWVLGQDVALKLFPSDLDEATQQRVRREILLARQLSHPNIVRSYDIGVHGGRPFITMELLRGHDLVDELDDEVLPLPLLRVVTLLMQVCEGLEHAHQQGVTHRDIKPENLFVGHDGAVRIMDFGLAKRVDARRAPNSNAITGTVPYMSPEQIGDFEAVTHATDIYALGAVAYELLTGQTPFEHPELTAMIAAHLSDTPRPPSALRPDVPPELDRIVLKALEKDPARRFTSCRAMSLALEAVQIALRAAVA